jgi:kelch-like protein 1/4/5
VLTEMGWCPLGTGHWSRLSSMSVCRSSFGVAALNGKIYVAGGGGGGGGDSECHDSVECFCPYTNRWAAVAPLRQGGRSGLTLASI